MNRREMLEETFRGLTRSLSIALPAAKGWLECWRPVPRPVGNGTPKMLPIRPEGTGTWTDPPKYEEQGMGRKGASQDFPKFCGISARALGLSATHLSRLKEAPANPNAPPVIWLQGGLCTGCSVSFPNRISTVTPLTAADVLIQSTDLILSSEFHGLGG